MTPVTTVAIGTRLQPGPFGGGNQFARALGEYLNRHRVRAVFDLARSDIDVVLVTGLKPWARGAAFDAVAALQYAARHPQAKVVLRVNECDQRKGRRLGLLNHLIRATMARVDHTVFVSAWLQNILLTQPRAPDNRTSVIVSGADPRIFNPQGRARWDGHTSLRVITHHWSSSWRKGWDAYQALDGWLAGPLKGRFTFTFVGNPWPGARLTHTRVVPPLSSLALARLLKTHHVYLTGSLNEPAGMHAVEALQCGLPIIYRSSGSLPEYCRPFGVGFADLKQLFEALHQMRAQYERWWPTTTTVPYSAEVMSRAYQELFAALTPRPGRRPLTADLRLRQGAVWVRDSLP